ncbi:hypothetical protein QJS04_geneDACA006404 [Acorus gramineus]|uniref:Uncharacterized protein n=1 Tax=Acorus gramineus TaxID=55184 RepID=A0AAV9AY20_ACOGR|nr:hypothetical protein QJS04_geneDACA006404 [Acorus gramineus]
MRSQACIYRETWEFCGILCKCGEEFSIQWDSRAFEFKMSNPGVQASDRPRKGGSLHSVNNETTIKKGDHEIPSQGGFDLSPKSTTKKEYVTIKRRDIKIESRDIKVESRDIHIVSSTMNDIRKDPSKTTTKAFEKENPKPNSTDNLVPPPIKNRNSKIGPHAEDVQTKCIDPSSNAGAGYRHQNTQMGSERVIQEERVDEKAKPNVSSYRNIPPPYVKPNGVSKQVGADQNKPADEHKPERAQEKSDDIERGKEERKLGGEDLSKPKPRSVRWRNPRVIHIEEEDSAKIEGGRRRHPPTSVPTLDDDLGRPTYDEDRVVVGDQDVSGRRRHTSRSVPTLNDDLGRPTYDDDIVVVDDQHAIGGRTHNTRRRASSYTNDRERVESHREEKVMDTRNTSGRRRRGMRHGFPAFDDERDNEDEMIMDNLLIHYSKKGLSDKSYTPRPPRAKPPKLHVNKGSDLPPCRDDGTQLAVEVGHPPVRAVSLPPTSDSPKEAAKVPVRAASLQPDLLIPMGKHVHPKLPDYDELAARFNALKKM